MGRYSEPLAGLFADYAAPASGRVLDVGCGPGALTARLVQRLGLRAVTAIDPSAPFITALRERLPGIEAQVGAAESLPFPDGAFDASLAQLVVHFMADPVAGLREMARVTRPGCPVAACVWDNAGGGSPLAIFWRAVNELDPGAHDESGRAGSRQGDLARLFAVAGLHDIEHGSLTVTVRSASFADWWEPFTLDVGPAGDYMHSLDQAGRDTLRARCAQLVGGEPGEPVQIRASAWCARGLA